jgi:hypothetical protein
MGTLHAEMIADMAEIEGELGNPSFVWNNVSYTCIASLSQFNRDLVEGGFTVEQMLTITIPRYDPSGNETFPGDVIPQAQQRIMFNGKPFRIENVKQDSVFDYGTDGVATTNGARIRIVSVGITRGL